MPPLTAKKMQKIGKKREKIRKNREEKAKIVGRFFDFAPPLTDRPGDATVGSAMFSAAFKATESSR